MEEIQENLVPINEDTTAKPSRFDQVITYITTHPYFIIIGLIFIVYVRTNFFDYVLFDDSNFIFDHPENIKKLQNFWYSITSSFIFTPYYRPLVNFTFFIGAQITGESPFTHHFINFILHCVNSCLVFILLRKLKFSEFISLMAVLVFSVHPLLTNAIVWIVGRCDLLVSLFGLLSFIYLIKYFENNKKPHLISHGIFYFLAVFSKEFAQLLPLIFGVYWWLYHRDKKFDLSRVPLIIFWIFPILLHPFLKYLFNIALTNDNFSFANMLVNYRVPIETISKFFLPFNIVQLPSFTIFTTILGIIISISLLIYYLTKRKILDTKGVLFGLSWFLILFGPVLIVRMVEKIRLSDYIDCRSYLPLIGFIIFIIELIPQHIRENSKKAIFYSTVFIVIILSILSFSASSNYKDSKTYRKTAVENNQNIALWFVGVEPKQIEQMVQEGTQKARIGDFKGAIAIYDKIVTADPLSYQNIAQRAAYKFKLKDFAGALTDYSMAISLNPEDRYSLFQRAYILVSQKKYRPAIEDLNKVLDVEKENYMAYYQRGMCKLYVRDYQAAMMDCNKSLEIKPNNSDAYLLRAAIFVEMNQISSACPDLQKALKLGNPYALQYIEEFCSKKKKTK